jgi:hypothetical protein
LYVAAPATTRNLTPVVFFCLACRAKQLPEQFQNAVGSSPDSLLRHPVQALLLRQTSAHVGRNLRRLKKRYADCVCGGGAVSGALVGFAVQLGGPYATYAY